MTALTRTGDSAAVHFEPVLRRVRAIRRSRSPSCSGRGLACPGSGVGQRDQSTSPAGPSRTSGSSGSSESPSRTDSSRSWTRPGSLSPGRRQLAPAPIRPNPLACARGSDPVGRAMPAVADMAGATHPGGTRARAPEVRGLAATGCRPGSG